MIHGFRRGTDLNEICKILNFKNWVLWSTLALGYSNISNEMDYMLENR